MKILKRITCLLLNLSLFFLISDLQITIAAGGTNSMSIRSYLQLNKIDAINIIYWPKGSSGSQKIVKTINDSKVIDDLLNELDKIPAKGSGRHIKLDELAPEYRMEFFRQKDLISSLRIKADMLDAPFDKNWDFYDGRVDKKFVKLVKNLF